MDLVDCDDVTEPAILNELEKRYLRDEIYSSIGPILISLNPYRTIPTLYDSEHLNKYTKVLQNSSDLIQYTSQSPHVWMVPHNAYHQLKFDSNSQALVISGESGAGKTETTKKCLQVLSSIETQKNPRKGKESHIEDRILATNPILESFGNAKTARNNNSSRFGKWIQINYKLKKSLAPDGSNKINADLAGAQIIQYLLEKSRVVVHAAEERNYHIFYQICASGILDLQPAASYNYLRYSKNLKINGVDDKEEFKVTYQSMIDLGFSSTYIDSIFEILKGILLLGNIEFCEDQNGYAILNPDFVPLVNTIAKLLGWSPTELITNFITRSMKIRNETTFVNFTSTQSYDAVNAFAKEIYGRLFSFIVSCANNSLKSNEDEMELNEPHSFIGLLDIFGFEKFKHNTFEQLCINYANEKLQQYFINYIIKKEQELYFNEGIPFPEIVLIDNNDIINLLENKKNGFFSLLNDELKLPKGSDESFLKRVEQEHNNKQNANRKFFKDVKMTSKQFEIRHFAGDIRYDCQGFLEKNRDKLYENLENLFEITKHDSFRKIMLNETLIDNTMSPESSSVRPNVSNSSATITTIFQDQLQQLMDVLSKSQPHFIKCIKPNNNKQELTFDKEMILLQLRYSGVLEALQIRKSGFPTRRTLEIFWKNYWMLTRNPQLVSRFHLSELPNDYEKCKIIIDNLPYSDIKLGKSLIFLKPNIIKDMEKEKEKRKLKAIVFTQAFRRKQLAIQYFSEKVLVRNHLLSCLNKGEEMNRSNISMIPAIEEAIEKSKQYELPKWYINQAIQLNSRLYEVKKCLEILETFVPRNDEINDPNIDVVGEYQELKKLVSIAQELGIESPSLEAVLFRLETLRERAECLLRLRDSIEQKNEIMIRENLAALEILIVSYGQFCENEYQYAKHFLSLIDEDFTILEDTSNLFISFIQYCDENKDNLSEIPSLLDSFIDQLSSCILVWKNRGIFFVAIDPYFQEIDKIINFLQNWKYQNWDFISKIIESLKEETSNQINLLSSYQTLRPDRVEHIALAWDILTQYINLCSILTQRDIYVGFLLPNWLNAISIKSNSEEDLIDSIEKLSSTLHEFGVLNWILENPATQNGIMLMNYLMILRESNLERKWEKIIQFTLTLVEYSKKQGIFDDWLRLLKERNIQSNRYDESFYSQRVLLPEEISQRESICSNILTKWLAEDHFLVNEFEPYELVIKQEYFDIKQKSIEMFILEKLLIILEKEVDSSSSILLKSPSLQLNKDNLVDTLSFLQSWNSLFPSSLLNKLLSLFTNFINLLNLFINENWSEIINSWKNNIYSSLLNYKNLDSCEYGSLEYVGALFKAKTIQFLAKSNQNFNESTFIQRIRHERIVYGEKFQETSFNSGPSTLELTKNALKNLEELNNYGEVGLSMYDFIYLLIQITETRTLFRESMSSSAALLSINASSDEDDVQSSSGITNETLLESVHKYDDKFQEFVSTELFPDIVEQIYDTIDQEIGDFKKIIRYREYFVLMKGLIERYQPLNYFLPYLPNRLRTASASMAVLPVAAGSSSPLRVKSLSFDLGLSPVLANPNIHDMDTILKGDGFTLDYEKLAIEDFEENIQKINDFKDQIYSEEKDLPEEFLDYFKAFSSIFKLRKFLIESEWQLGLNYLEEIINDPNLIMHVPVVINEINLNRQPIENYAMISTCLNSLSKGFPIGPIGLVDYRLINISMLENSLNFCKKYQHVTQRVQDLILAINLILKLRTAQRDYKWEEIKSILQEINENGIGTHNTEVCFTEISRANIEKDNHEAIKSICLVLKTEELKVNDGLIDCDAVSIKELPNVISKVVSLPEDSKGTVVKELLSLADTIMKTRRLVAQKQWYPIENMLPLLKEQFESFQNELDSFGSNSVTPNQRKNLGTRASSFHRGTIFAAATQPSKSLNIVTLTSSEGKNYLWDDLLDTNLSINNEIKSLEHYFEITKLEKQFLSVLSKDGVHAAKIGDIKKDNIKVEELENCLEFAQSLDSTTFSIPFHLKQLKNVGQLLFKLRKFVICDDWDNISSLLKDAIHNEITYWPEYCQEELRVIRLEVENRWIIDNLKNALKKGQLEGDLDTISLTQVSNHHLKNYISTSKAMNPTTENACKLISTTEAMDEMRNMLISSSIQENYLTTNRDPKREEQLIALWDGIKIKCKEILQKLKLKKFDEIIFDEINLIYELSEDRIICYTLEKALKSNCARGEPGTISLSSISTVEFDKLLLQKTKIGSKSYHVKFLFSVCETMKKVRELLSRINTLEIRSANTKGFNKEQEEIFQIWADISSHLKPLLEDSVQDSSVGNKIPNGKISENKKEWLACCQEEIDLTINHSFIENIKHQILLTAIHASVVYSNRNQRSLLVLIDNWISIQESDPNLQHNKQDQNTKSEQEDYNLLCQELDQIINKMQSVPFFNNNKQLQHYFTCCNILKLFRNTISDNDWKQLDKLIHDVYYLQYFEIVPELKQEYIWMSCEYHNHMAFNILMKAILHHSLYFSHIHGGKINRIEETKAFSDIKKDHLLAITPILLRDNNFHLKNALESCSKYQITSPSLKEFLEICKSLFLLREEYLTNNHKIVQTTFQWFKQQNVICPVFVLYEVECLYILYQNQLFISHFEYILLHYRPIGTVGNLNYENVQNGIDLLQELLSKAYDINPKLPKMMEFIEDSNTIINVRRCLIEKDMVSLYDIINEIAVADKVSLNIIDEIALARNELDNYTSIQALTKSLQSFDDRNNESNALDLIFLQSEDPNELSINNTLPQATSPHGEILDESEINPGTPRSKKEKGRRPTMGLSILETLRSERRYSFANKHSTDLDLETVDIEVLDQGIRIAKVNGLFSEKAKRLYQTVVLVRKLRSALKASRWDELSELLVNLTPFDETEDKIDTFNGTFYDTLAQKEIIALKSQVDMRKAIVDLSKSLKTGWAKCNHGIVDTSEMNNEVLAEAIELAEHYLNELSNQTNSSKNSKSSNAATSQLNNPNNQIKSSEYENNSIFKKPARKVRFPGEKEEDQSDSSEKFTSSSSIGSKIQALNSKIQEKEETSIQKQLKLLMKSAHLIYEIREILIIGDIEQAGYIADQALTNENLHYTVIEELKFYSKEISQALNAMKLIDMLQESRNSASIITIERSLNSLTQSKFYLNQDLGLILIFLHSEQLYEYLFNIRSKILKDIDYTFDYLTIQESISLAKRSYYSDSEIFILQEKFTQLELFHNILRKLHTFLSNTTINQEQIRNLITNFIQYSYICGFQNHPFVKLLELIVKFTSESFHNYIMMQSICPYSSSSWRMLSTYPEKSIETKSPKSGDDYRYNAIYNQTILHKLQFLLSPTCINQFDLANFPRLRPIQEYSYRMMIISKELSSNRLSHISTSSLPTSLTSLTPYWASLACYIFTNHVYMIENKLSSRIDYLAQKIIILGQKFPILRDEIYIQILKQITGNENPDNCIRLWRLLLCCLYYFPPSLLLESYLELFLLKKTSLSNFFDATNASSVQQDNLSSSSTKSNIQPIRNTKPKPNTSTITMNLKINQIPEKIISPIDKPEIKQKIKVFAERAVRYTHRAIFLFGYDIKLNSTIQIEDISPWFEDENYDPIMLPTDEEVTLLDQFSQLTQFNHFCNSQTKDLQSSSERETQSKKLGDIIIYSRSDGPDPIFIFDKSLKNELSKLYIHKENALLRHVGLNNIRGSREDWNCRYLALFKQHELYQAPSLPTTSKSRSMSIKTRASVYHTVKSEISENQIDSFIVSRKIFCQAIAATLTGKGQLDFIDRDILFFLIMAKRPSFKIQIIQEFRLGNLTFNNLTQKEQEQSEKRSHEFEKSINISEFASELFLSQLQPNDYLLQAEKFWDGYLVPILKNSDSSMGKGDEVPNTLDYLIYRDLIRTGMKKFLALAP